MKTTIREELISGRTADLRAAFVRQKRAGAATVKEALQRAIDSPASRFWVSAERAAAIVSNMRRRKTLRHLSPMKREMFRDIYKRYRLMHHAHPEQPMLYIVERIVQQPAPKFYISLRTALRDICDNSE